MPTIYICKSPFAILCCLLLLLTSCGSDEPVGSADLVGTKWKSDTSIQYEGTDRTVSYSTISFASVSDMTVTSSVEKYTAEGMLFYSSSTQAQMTYVYNSGQGTAKKGDGTKEHFVVQGDKLIYGTDNVVYTLDNGDRPVPPDNPPDNPPSPPDDPNDEVESLVGALWYGIGGESGPFTLEFLSATTVNVSNWGVQYEVPYEYRSGQGSLSMRGVQCTFSVSGHVLTFTDEEGTSFSLTLEGLATTDFGSLEGTSWLSHLIYEGYDYRDMYLYFQPGGQATVRVNSYEDGDVSVSGTYTYASMRGTIALQGQPFATFTITDDILHLIPTDPEEYRVTFYQP